MTKLLLSGNALLLVLVALLLWPGFGHNSAFQGTQVLYLAAGQPEHHFSQRLAQGARDAAADLGCEIDLLWTNWDASRTTIELKNAIEMAPDAICIPGFPRSPEFDAFIGEAFRRGIAVTSYNVPSPEFLDQFGAAGFGYAGQDNFTAGERLVRALIAQLKLVSGDRAVIFGMPSAPDRGKRAEGCVAALEAAGLVADVVDTYREADEEPLQPDEEIRAYLREHPEVKLMIWESYPAHVAARVLRELGYKPGEIPVAGWDLNPEILEEIESGYITLTYDQQPYLQGYLPVLQACLTDQRGFAGFYADTSGPFVDLLQLPELRPRVERRWR
jgi:simple sugar transport system substrate-binding protein